MSLRKLAKDIFPPMLTRALRKLYQRQGLIGDYPNWEAAVAAAPTYKTTDLSIADAAAERARRGEQGPDHSFFPILAGILLAGDHVRVLDFGGGLGRYYFHTMRVIPDRIEWWRVVELPEMVEYGQANFSENKLSFFTSANEALAGEKPDVIHCGAVLQCLEDPYDSVAALLKMQPRILILTRFPLHRRERFMVLKAVPELGIASYAFRILAEDKLKQATHGYKMIAEQCAGNLEPQNPTLTEERYVSQVFVSSDG
jgi:putative methyltransferase (TIGR04325 family)